MNLSTVVFHMVLPMIFDIVAGLLAVVETSGIPSPQFAVDKHLLSSQGEGLETTFIFRY